MPARNVHPLEFALRSFERLRSSSREAYGLDKLLQPVSEQPWIYFGCDIARDAPVPIYTANHGDNARLVLPSIGELVHAWIEMIDSGGIYIDGDGEWQHDDEKIPERFRFLGIA